MVKTLIFFLAFGLIGFYGGFLLYLTQKQKIKKPLKIFLLLTGASALSFPVFSIFHNLLYALETISKDLPLISGLTGALHALFFIIAVIAAPLGFLIGIIGSLVLLLRRKN